MMRFPIISRPWLFLLASATRLDTFHAFHNTVSRPAHRHSSSLSSSTTDQPDVSRFVTGSRPAGTEQYVMQQTMVRVKDPIKSLEFYCDILGFRLVMFREFPQWEFNVYFVAPVDASDIPSSKEEQWKFCMNTPGCIELTWNYGSETQDGLVYNTGNADSTGTTDGQNVKGGFGHLGITVPDVYEACARFAELGCEFTKTPNSGGMKGLAFVKDPDGYLVEVLPRGEMIQKPIDHAGVAVDGGEGYKDNSK
ncbi:Lactoylglutathione lyase [Seminavis robusta]|uniref:lactoylglutathione lyase n=1 Tax=Seminavis robusta TaxID=568900 RepID=A0A9N8HSZ0_9STRA|nr:Lactoylglutathione lyase [Seminavis robusta]|eukprot:Sro1445_g273340.1 Lactoylglutathione lyase (251) ;mRNA; f:1452-2204